MGKEPPDRKRQEMFIGGSIRQREKHLITCSLWPPPRLRWRSDAGWAFRFFQNGRRMGKSSQNQNKPAVSGSEIIPAPQVELEPIEDKQPELEYIPFEEFQKSLEN